MGRSEKIQQYEFWGLVLFVGIPLPGTGAWTGALIASLLGIDIKKVLTGYSLRNCHGNGDHVHCILCTGGKYRELVHRFVNNCIIHAGYGSECAVQKIVGVAGYAEAF